MNEQLATIEHAKNTVLDLMIRFGPKLLAALVVLAVGVLVSRWIAQWLERALVRIDLEPPGRLLLARVVRLLILGLFLIMALQNLGVELLPLIAGLGVVGAGLALGMQGVLGNVAAGLSIIFTKPFRVGEYISIAGEEGRVETITLFSTTLSHPDLSLVVVPNRKIAGEILHNFGQRRQLRRSLSAWPATPISARRSLSSTKSSRPIPACCAIRYRSSRPASRGHEYQHQRHAVGRGSGLRCRAR